MSESIYRLHLMLAIMRAQGEGNFVLAAAIAELLKKTGLEPVAIVGMDA